MTNPNQEGSLCGVACGEDQPVLVRFEQGMQSLKIGFPPGDKSLQLLELRQADRRLHVGYFQVVADVGIDVFMVVTEGQGAELLGEPFPAAVRLPAGAVAIAAPIAHRTGDASEQRIARQDAAALSHRDVMGGIEGDGGQVAEGAGQPAAVARAQRVAVILHHPQPVVFREPRHGIQVERDAHRVGHRNGARFRGDRLFDPRRDGGVVAEVDVDKNGHQVVLQQWARAWWGTPPPW